VRSTSPSTAPPGNDRSLKPLDLDYLDLSLLLDVTPSDEELARIDALDTGTAAPTPTPWIPDLRTVVPEP
jgi:hypothetical protein